MANIKLVSVIIYCGFPTKVPEGLMRQTKKYSFVMEGHSLFFFVHILEHGHCLNILVISYKEFHSPFQTSIVIKIFMSNYYRNLT